MRYSSLTAFYELRLVCMLAVLVGGHSPMASTANGDEPPAPNSRQSTSEQTVNYSVIVTGNELLSGVYADGHTIYLTKTLRPLGLHCVGSMSVDDQAGAIRRALKFTLPHSQLVIVTGGLGPTQTDITRDVLANFTGIALREHPDVLRHLEKRFGTSRDDLRANLRRQTRVPVHGTFLPNASGTAVGLVFEYDNKVIVALPGPPRELQPMVRDQLIPYLAKKFGVRTLGSSLTVRFIGIGQSQIDQTMKEHIRLPKDVMQTSQFKSARVDFTFSLPGDTTDDHQRLEQLRRELHKYLGDHIYADDSTTTLEEAAIKQLGRRQQTVALVELGSGGMVAAGFAQAPHGRDVMTAAYVTANPGQLQRILQIPRDSHSRELQLGLIANAARTLSQSDWAIVVGSPEKVAGTSESRVRILIKTPDNESIERSLPWHDPSPSQLTRLATEVFDLLRRSAGG